MSIASNLYNIQRNIRSATKRPVTIVAVTKGRTLEEIREAVAAGIMVIGENRWQEAESKLPELPEGVTKHFIGHLQTNKVREVIAAFDLIQSADSVRLVEAIDRECAKIGKVMPILIQVNTSGEPQKSGLDPEEAVSALRAIAPLKHVRIEGLMTLAIHSNDPKKVHACFQKLRVLFEQIKKESIFNVTMTTLSMGMTDDYALAIEEGATLVRIGRGIFG